MTDSLGASPPDRVAPGDLQPSQLSLDAAKVRAVLGWLDADAPAECLDPRPVLPCPESAGWYLTDGHTRAFCAHLAGSEAVPVARDPDAAALDAETDGTCLE